MSEDQPNFVNKPYSPIRGDFVKTLRGGGSGDMDLIESESGKMWVIRDTSFTIGKVITSKVVRKYCQEFEGLRKYGYNIPDFHPFIADFNPENTPYKRSKGVYLAVDFVDGVPLSEAPEEIREEVRRINEEYYLMRLI